MNKKQIVGLIVAAAVFVVVGSISTLLHVVLNGKVRWSADWLNGEESYEEDWYGDGEYDYDLPEEEFIGLVEVKGDIFQESGYSYYDYYGDFYDHEWTLGYIDQLIENSENQGLLLYVDSSGGGVYESDELYLKLLEYKEETGRPVWTYMASTACSGGYYISMASDRIYCNRNGVTGSIGVIMTVTDYTSMMDRLGITETNITSGSNKAMGSETEKMTEEQKSIFQSMVDETYEQFVDVVAQGRNMTREEVRAVSDGRVYTAKQALELKLIDEIATYEQMKEAFEAEVGSEVVAMAAAASPSAYENQEQRIQSGREETELQQARWYQEWNTWKKVGRPMYYAR